MPLDCIALSNQVNAHSEGMNWKAYLPVFSFTALAISIISGQVRSSGPPRKAGGLQNVNAVEQAGRAAVKRNAIHPVVYRQARHFIAGEFGKIDFISQVDKASLIVCEEVFGPVIA